MTITIVILIAGLLASIMDVKGQTCCSGGVPLANNIGGTPSSILLKDDVGNQWNIFGEAVAGPRMGEKLIPTTSFIGYWFSWGAFYPGIEISDVGM